MYNASLDSSQSQNWEVAQNENWPPGDIYYDAAEDTLDMAQAQNTTAALGTSFSWGYQTCRKASYGGNANAPQYGNIAAGHGLCFKSRTVGWRCSRSARSQTARSSSTSSCGSQR
jgi:hypothetical protein